MHGVIERDKKWYLIIFGILFLIVGYAIYTNGIIMAITFILIGVVGYIYINKEPQILNFMITDQGVFAGALEVDVGDWMSRVSPFCIALWPFSQAVAMMGTIPSVMISVPG